MHIRMKDKIKRSFRTRGKGIPSEEPWEYRISNKEPQNVEVWDRFALSFIKWQNTLLRHSLFDIFRFFRHLEQHHGIGIALGLQRMFPGQDVEPFFHFIEEDGAG